MMRAPLFTLLTLAALTQIASARPDTPGSRDLYRFDAGDIVETFDSLAGDFKVHYTRAGTHAVPDGDVVGVPDSVSLVAEIYDDVLGFYRDDLGFRPPISDGDQAQNGGDDRFDVYLVDFGGIGDGHYTRESCTRDQCAGYMAQENDFAGYHYPSLEIAVRILGSHEFFHGVQAAYDVSQNSVISEGTAVWATEKFDPSLRDFEAFLPGFLDRPDRPLDEPMPGPVDGFSYGSAIFFMFLDERYGTEIIPALWERCVDGAEGVPEPQWLLALDALLEDAYDTTFADMLVEFATWNLYLGSFGDPELSYAHGNAYSTVAMEASALPFEDDRVRLFRSSTNYWRFSPNGREGITAALVGDDEDLVGLRLFIGGRFSTVSRPPSGTQFVPVEVALEGGDVVDTDGWDTAVIYVVNTNLEGSSMRPGLCIGSPDEVRACVEAQGGEVVEPEPDAGVDAPDGAVADAGVEADGEVVEPGDEGGDDGGCQAIPGAPVGGSAALLLLTLPALLRRRRLR